MRRYSSVIVLAVLLAAAGASSDAKDLTIVSKVTPAKGSPTTSTQYFAEKKMRLSDGQFDTIVDMSAGTMIQVDHKKKAYYQTTFEEMRAHFAELEQMIASNPMMAQMVGKVSEVKVEKTAEKREIVGHVCQKYLLTMGESFRETLWITPDLEFPSQYYEASKMMYAMMGPAAVRFEKMIDAMKQLEGVPLATDIDLKIMGMDSSSSSEVTQISRDPVPANAFDPPAGYKQKKSPFQE